MELYRGLRDHTPAPQGRRRQAPQDRRWHFRAERVAGQGRGRGGTVALIYERLFARTWQPCAFQLRVSCLSTPAGQGAALYK
jgi:hypothetical protein